MKHDPESYRCAITLIVLLLLYAMMSVANESDAVKIGVLVGWLVYSGIDRIGRAIDKRPVIHFYPNGKGEC